ncbi:hypothetical protein PUN28_002922 [Cardiocondyla obscurior]|uniref:Uncharacterized protein n=1 Tax=Cardiocondyla obscurior TaxID=286306 RepID=A0AAW2GWM4_9HYME
MYGDSTERVDKGLESASAGEFLPRPRSAVEKLPLASASSARRGGGGGGGGGGGTYRSSSRLQTSRRCFTNLCIMGGGVTFSTVIHFRFRPVKDTRIDI